MSISTQILPELIAAVEQVIEANAEQVTALDQAIGDGDHVINLQRGLAALSQQHEALVELEWSSALKKIGMTLMSSVGGASGSLYGTMFLAMSKSASSKQMDMAVFAGAFEAGVESMKQRGKSDLGEKTMLDVLIPVADSLLKSAADKQSLDVALSEIPDVAAAGVEATRDMLATKGRASFLGERTRGCIDAGAKTAQLMITAIVQVLQKV